MRKILIIFAVLFCAMACCKDLGAHYTQSRQKRAAKELVERVVGDNSRNFTVRFCDTEGDDRFSYWTEDGKIVLEGNNGVSVASALYHYMKNCCYTNVDWSTDFPVTLPSPLPLPEEKVTHTSPYEYRYNLNYCTFNYSMSWWDEERWRKEIDLMALNGINMPLAPTGQNSVWQKVYRELGFTDEELGEFFCGPTHFSWFWMGNLDAWGGPLPQSFIDKHEELQKKILKAERLLGMKPVLPAFTGHVPPAFKEKFPDSQIHQTTWEGFAPVNILAPQDSMFTVIGNMFMEEQTKMYGTDHLYSADTFNENQPPFSDSLYLDGMSKTVYKSMSGYDPEAIWVMQGWLFHYQGYFWKEKEIRALLGGVPDDKMIILDLWSERFPVYGRTEAYYGKPWIWCMLHNFGQNQKWEGHMQNVATKPAEVRKSDLGKNMKGIGFTMEGIEQTPMMYALMAENIWRDEPVDLGEFMHKYLRNRYGEEYMALYDVWMNLAQTVFNQDVSGGGFPSAITDRPSLGSPDYRISDRHRENYAKPLNEAWRKMAVATLRNKDLITHDGFKYDYVDLTRQAMVYNTNVVRSKMAQAYKDGDAYMFYEHGTYLLEMIRDMETLLGTLPEFSLSTWIADAREMGTTPEEKDKYEFNARNLVTLWGDKDCKIHDYSWRHWSGLMNGFYWERWHRFIEGAVTALDEKREFDMKAFEEEIKNWEWEWCNTVNKDDHKYFSTGDPVERATSVYLKYYVQMK